MTLFQLGRTRNSDGTFVYRGACDDVLCIEAGYNDTDPDSIFDCCEGLQCNSDITVFPAGRFQSKPQFCQLKDCLPCLFHGFRNNYFNKISLDIMLYFLSVCPR